ncbi:hypothetical protein FOL47_004026 [Perkinsus chesapeaki]|uniref:GS catalytic domain-containing protein n=1 Tax=Perkinsus chesapeaki TaxID=330153 RepID=A0A7J6M678_PERCH|nr:hypothetical protein FOL47_004026 [Perkinsus chesapeaki]
MSARHPPTRDVPLGSFGKSALLVIDVQRQCSVAGEGIWADTSRADNPYFFNQVDNMLGNISKLLDATRKMESHSDVIYTYIEALTADCRDASLDYKLSGGPSRPLLVPKGSKGAEILTRVRPEANDILIPKTSCSVFQSTNIDYVLRNLGTKHLVVVGQLTNQCVESCVRDAADLGYLVTVVEDACAALCQEDHSSALNNLKGFARIMSTAAVLTELAVSDPTPPSAARQEEVVPKPKEPVVWNRLPFVNCHYEHFSPFKLDFCGDPFGLAQALLSSLKACGVQLLRFMVCDVSGQIRSKSIAIHNSTAAESLLKGVPFVTCLNALPSYGDAICGGASSTGSQNLVADFSTLTVVGKSAYVFGNMFDPITDRPGLCPRSILKEQCLRAEKDFGIRIQCGVEMEFILFERGVQASSSDMPFKPLGDPSNFASDSAMTASRAEAFISDLLKGLSEQPNTCRPVDLCHAEAAWGQFEVSLRYIDDPVKMADSVVTTRQTLRRLADVHGLGLCLLPKISSTAVGSGMHSHWSFCDVGGEKNALVSEEGRYGLSVKGSQFMSGVLGNLKALTAVTLPCTNSYRRMVDGYWAGTYQCWAYEDKESPIRLCGVDTLTRNSGGLPSNFEVKAMDALCNPYLAFTAIISCGLAGITNKSVLPEPVPLDCVDRAAVYDSVPRDLGTALDHLEGNTVIKEAFGEVMMSYFLCVKRAEFSYYKDMAIGDEVKALVGLF